jgi:hypothetical protein
MASAKTGRSSGDFSGLLLEGNRGKKMDGGGGERSQGLVLGRTGPLLEEESQEALPSITQLADVDYLDARPYRSLKKINRVSVGL